MSKSTMPDINADYTFMSKLEPVVRKWCEDFDWHQYEIEQLIHSLKKSICDDKLCDNIFSKLLLTQGENAKYPLDIYNKNKELTATIMPVQNGHAVCTIDSDEIFIPTYKISSLMSLSHSYFKNKRTDVICRALNIFFQAFVKKIKYDKMACMVKAASMNNAKPLGNLKILSEDFINRGQTLTHILISKQTMSNIVNESPTSLIDNTNLSQIKNDTVPRLTGLNETYGIKILISEGISDYYYKYIVNKNISWYRKFWNLVIRKNPVEKEVMIGLDINECYSLMHVLKKDGLCIFNDITFTETDKVGVYGWMENGIGILNTNGLGLAYLPFDR